jgi:hypothetical protein
MGCARPAADQRSGIGALESRLFDAKTAALVWGPTAESVTPPGDERIARFVRACWFPSTAKADPAGET